MACSVRSIQVVNNNRASRFDLTRLWLTDVLLLVGLGVLGGLLVSSGVKAAVAALNPSIQRPEIYGRF
jgi:hypothetical protein